VEDLSFGKSIMEKVPRRHSRKGREEVELPGEEVNVWAPLSDAQKAVYRESTDGDHLVVRDLEQAHFNVLIHRLTGQIESAIEQQDQTETMYCFFATFECVCSGEVLLRKFLERFDPPPSTEQVVVSASTLSLIQKKVIRCLSYWHDKHALTWSVPMLDILEVFFFFEEGVVVVCVCVWICFVLFILFFFLSAMHTFVWCVLSGPFHDISYRVLSVFGDICVRV
jgi:RasGEF N-terminal motif